jgi:hypothetical protein
MNSFRKFPWISFVLLTIAYFIFGWFYGEWSFWILAEIKSSYWLQKIEIDTATIDILGGFLLVAIVLVFTGAVTLLTSRIIRRLKTQLQVFISVIGGSLIIVSILYWFEYFIRFLVLFAAAALFRIELRNAGFRKERAAMTLAICCLIGFIAGVVSATLWSGESTLERSLTTLLRLLAAS